MKIAQQNKFFFFKLIIFLVKNLKDETIISFRNNKVFKK